MVLVRLLVNFCITFGLLFFGVGSVQAQAQLITELYVSNPLNVPRLNAKVLIPIKLLSDPFSSVGKSFVVMEHGKVVPSQLYASLIDQQPDSLLVVSSFGASERKNLQVFSVTEGLPEEQKGASTYAELAVRIGGSADVSGSLKGGDYLTFSNYRLPSSHKIGDKLFKYEGMGWESEQVAYRYYYDNRGAIDVFGKIKSVLALKQVGLDGDDYHQLNDWGMDVLKVGKSLGVGALGANEQGTIVNVSQFDRSHTAINNGALMSEIDLWHDGWQLKQGKHDLHTRLRIIKGSALTQVSALTAQGLKEFATGVVNHNVEIFKSSENDQQWCYLATYGNQSLAKDNLGLGVFFECKDRHAWLTTEDNVAVLLTQQKSQLDYYLFATWSAQPQGIKTSEQFQHFLNKTVEELNVPISVTLNSSSQ
jgi:hypothetical protein